MSDSYQPGPNVFAVVVASENRGQISLAKRKFRLRNEIASQGPPQAIETIGLRNYRFRGFQQFQGVPTRFFAPLSDLDFSWPVRRARKQV